MYNMGRCQHLHPESGIKGFVVLYKQTELKMLHKITCAIEFFYLKDTLYLSLSVERILLDDATLTSVIISNLIFFTVLIY